MDKQMTEENTTINKKLFWIIKLLFLIMHTFSFISQFLDIKDIFKDFVVLH